MTIEEQKRVIEDFIAEQFIISDSDELDRWLAHLAHNEHFDKLADVIERFVNDLH